MGNKMGNKIGKVEFKGGPNIEFVGTTLKRRRIPSIGRGSSFTVRNLYMSTTKTPLLDLRIKELNDKLHHPLASDLITIREYMVNFALAAMIDSAIRDEIHAIIDTT